MMAAMARQFSLTNPVFYRVAADPSWLVDGVGPHDLLLVGATCCDEPHQGAGPGCLGNPARGARWAIAPHAENLSVFTTGTVVLEALTVSDAMSLAAEADAEAVIGASIAALQLMALELCEFEESHEHDRAAEVRSELDPFRRQVAAAMVTCEVVPDTWWEELVSIDALTATRREHTLLDRDDDPGDEDGDKSAGVSGDDGGGDPPRLRLV